VFPGFSISSPNRKRGVLSGFYRPTSLGGARIGLGEWQDHLSQILTIRAEPLRRSGSMPCQTPVSENARHSSSENARYGAAAMPLPFSGNSIGNPKLRATGRRRCPHFGKYASQLERPTPIRTENLCPSRHDPKQRAFSEAVPQHRKPRLETDPAFGCDDAVATHNFGREGDPFTPPQRV
jgi:hypothetical protein